MTLREQKKLYNRAAKAIAGYKQNPEIIDIEFGVKYTGGIATGELCIRFNMIKKKGLQFLKANQILPSEIDGFKTDVVEISNELQLGSYPPQTKIRPVIGGTQILSEVFQSDPYAFGTLGCIFTVNGTLVGITNYHVLFGSVPESVVRQYYANKARVFQNLFHPTSDNNVGVAAGAFDQNLDYALFAINVPADMTQSINGLSGIIQQILITEPIYGQTKVKKSGATTDVTYGIVSGRSLMNPSRLSIVPDPSHPTPGIPISDGGDSGSLWVLNDNTSPISIVGLHYQGNGSNSAGAISFDYIVASINKQTQ